MNDMINNIKKKVSIPKYFYEIIMPQMSDYYSDYTVNFDAKPVIKCCLHDEDTPSMRFYEETNTFFCFGCRVGGDVVQLHRRFFEKMNGELPSFDESVRFIYNYFILGKESVGTNVLKKKTDEPLKSTVKDMIRFSGFIAKLEGQLSIDNTLKKETKKEVWETIDLMCVMVELNIVNSIEAIDYIKKKMEAL